jgi:hypothetical protein
LALALEVESKVAAELPTEEASASGAAVRLEHGQVAWLVPALALGDPAIA